MAKAKGDDKTIDLLSWQPPEPRVRFSEQKIRADSLSGRFSRAISLSLKESPHDREVIATRMSEYLGTEISTHMLNAYASEARTDHNISLHRYAALVHATEDWRLLSALVEIFPLSVIDQKYLSVIKLAQISEQKDLLKKQEAELKNKARAEGTI